MDAREREALDRHITGNYGEDQFRDEDITKTLAMTVSALKAVLAGKPVRNLDEIIAHAEKLLS